MQRNAKLHSCMALFPPQCEGATTASATSTHQWESEWMACAFSGPSGLGKLHVVLSERHFSAPCLHHLLGTVFHVPAFGFITSHLADLTPMPRKVCVASCLQAPGQAKLMGGSRRFSRGKPLQTAFWEESQAQIYICGPKLRIKGNSKCCKSGIYRVSILHLMLYMAKGLTAWKFVFLFPPGNTLLPTIRKMSFPTALDHMAVLVLLELSTSSHGIHCCRLLWEESIP